MCYNHCISIPCIIVCNSVRLISPRFHPLSEDKSPKAFARYLGKWIGQYGVMEEKPMNKNDYMRYKLMMQPRPEANPRQGKGKP